MPSKPFKLVTFGEVMMRLNPPSYKRLVQTDCLEITFGGGEANVSMALAALGLDACHVTVFPDSALGVAARQYLARFGVDTCHVQHLPGRIGLYFLEVGAAARASTVIYDRADSVFAKAPASTYNWERCLQEATHFHWTGITPGISQAATDALLEALNVSRSLGLTVSADINYRKNLWKYGRSVGELMPELISHTDIIFGSKGDIKEALSLEPEDEDDKYVPVCRALMHNMPQVKLCVNTKRDSVSASHNEISAVAFDGEQSYSTAKMPLTPIVDRIGGGDAFAAGFIYGHQANMTIEQALGYGLASAVLKHSQPGDASFAPLSEIEAVAGGDLSGRLVR